MGTVVTGRPPMAGVAEGSARFDEVKLSARVFFANKTAVAGLIIFLVFLGDALLVQIAPGVLGIRDRLYRPPPTYDEGDPDRHRDFLLHRPRRRGDWNPDRSRLGLLRQVVR